MKLRDLKSTDIMNQAIIWSQFVPEAGRELLLNNKDWDAVQNYMNEAIDHLDRFDPEVYVQDIEYIYHTIDLYQFLAKSRNDILLASNLYQEAHRSQYIDASYSRALLINSFQIINDLYLIYDEIKEQNRMLWLAENRVYAFDRVEAMYTVQLEALDYLRERINTSIFDFERGKILPNATEIGLQVTEVDGWYFQGWLMIDPIPNPNGAGDPMIDHLAAMSGISNTFPEVTQEFYFDNVKYRWRRVNTPYFAKVDLDELQSESINVVTYAFAHIDSPDEREVLASLGSSDGVEVFINGKSVYKNYIEREFQRDQDQFSIPLNNGRNHLMIRITNASGDWAFSFQLPDSEVRSHKNRYRIVE
jgi:hypothetical protein